MATEKCKICHDLATPWEYVPELKGHICSYCSYCLPVCEAIFNEYIQKLCITEDYEGTPMSFGKKSRQRITSYLNRKLV